MTKNMTQYLSNEQHGFLRKRSTLTNLLNFTHYVSNVLSNKGQVDVLYLDMEKAFDKVDHKVLLSCLSYYGCDNKTISFFRSYLSGRSQFVKYKDCRSYVYQAASGVPQGSVLGPWLFLLLIDSASKVVKNSEIDIFADDIKLYREVNNVQDFLLLLNDLIAIANWCTAHKIKLNINKCQVMSFCRKRHGPVEHNYVLNNHLLMRVHEICDLGVNFDRKLDFNSHVRLVNAKCLKSLGFILRVTKVFDNVSLVKILYFAFVRSRIDYNAILWYPSQKVWRDHLERIQRKFVNVLFFRCNGFYPTFPNNIAYSTLCNALQIVPISDRIDKSKLIFLFKLFNGHIVDPYLLGQCNFAVPKPGLRLKNNNTFYIYHMSDLSPLKSCLALFNQNNNLDLSFSFSKFVSCITR